MKKFVLYALFLALLMGQNDACICLDVNMIENENSVSDAQKCLLEDDRLKLYEMLKDRQHTVNEYCLMGKFILLIKLMLDTNVKNKSENRLPRQTFLDRYKYGKNIISSLKSDWEKCNFLLTDGNIEQLDELNAILPGCQTIDRNILKNSGEKTCDVAKFLFAQDHDSTKFKFEDEIWLYATFARSTTESGLKCTPIYVNIINNLERSIIDQYHFIQHNIADIKRQIREKYQSLRSKEFPEKTELSIIDSILESETMVSNSDNEIAETRYIDPQEKLSTIYVTFKSLQNKNLIISDSMIDDFIGELK